MQATVKEFDADSRRGTVLLDDGTELGFDAAAFDASGLRLVRPGQRVRVRMAGGRLTAVTLATFELPDDDSDSTT